MLNDYKGDEEFALVVPVPRVLEREQIHVGDKALFERIDAYSAPRLAEYHDDDPLRAPRNGTEESRPAQGPRREAPDGGSPSLGMRASGWCKNGMWS